MSLFDLMRNFRVFLRSFFIIIAAPLFISCGSNNHQSIKTSKVENVERKLDLLVIGDGAMAGFKLSDLSISRGRLNLEDSSVIGDSIPAYLARYIEMVSPSKLNSFSNISLVGSSVLD